MLTYVLFLIPVLRQVFFIWRFLDKMSPAFIQTWISLLIGHLLPCHAEICVEGKKEGV